MALIWSNWEQMSKAEPFRHFRLLCGHVLAFSLMFSALNPYGTALVKSFLPEVVAGEVDMSPAKWSNMSA